MPTGAENWSQGQAVRVKGRKSSEVEEALATLFSDILGRPGRRGSPRVENGNSPFGLTLISDYCIDAVVDGETGILVPPRDPLAIAEAVKKLLEDPDLRKKMGKAGRERLVRDFLPEDIWEALYQEYVQRLEEKGIPVPDPKLIINNKDVRECNVQ